MGKNSQRRRATKQRRADARRRDHERAGRAARDEPPRSVPVSLFDSGSESLFEAESESRSVSDDCGCEACRRLADIRSVCADAERRLLELLPRAVWGRGWQPSEVVRHVRRQTDAPGGAADLLTFAIAADAFGSPLASDPAWNAQVERLCVLVGDRSLEEGWVERWFVDQDDALVALAAIVWLPGRLIGLQVLPKLLPPPGEDHGDLRLHVRTASGATEARHDQIRALLAKAESTPYPAEAEAFTAKAQEMMTELRIDEAVLRASTASISGRRLGEASAIRVAVDEPYLTEKAMLLCAVAPANDTHAVLHRDAALSTLVGPVDQLGRVELLYMSLLIQVQSALTAEAEKYSPGDQRRGRRFRGSFIAGYAVRIGERLDQARDGIVGSVANAALPVLAADRCAADELLDELFGSRLSDMPAKPRDLAGLRAGSAAADIAHLRDDGLTGPQGGAAGQELSEAG